MDHFVLGKRRGYVNCEVLDADENGVSPDCDNFDESSPSLLDFIVETNDKVCSLVSVYIPMCFSSSVLRQLLGQ